MGGTAIYVPYGMDFLDRDDLSPVLDGCTECTITEISLNIRGHNRRVVICKIYRPPRALVPLFLESMHHLLTNNPQSRSLSCIMGDLNIDLLK